MGVLSNLIVFNAEGLEGKLEDMQAHLEAQEERLKSIESELCMNETPAHQGQHSGDAGSEHADRSSDRSSAGVAADRSGAIASFDSWGRRGSLSAPMQELTRRLMQSQQQQSDCMQRLERLEQASQSVAQQVLEGQTSRQNLLADLRSLESRLNVGEASMNEARAESLKSLEAVQAEFKRSYKAFEARCTLSEEKASECRREARAVREEHGGRDVDLSELQQQVRRIQTSVSQSALDTSQVSGVSRDRSLMSDVEAQISDLESRMRAKASECVVEAMRQDLEQSGRAVQDAVKGLMQKLADQEDRLNGLEISAAKSRSRERRGGDPSLPEEDGDEDASSRCLLCHSAGRSVSPNRVVMGSDNKIYGLAADPSKGPPEAAELLASLASLSSIAGARAQNISRPSRGPAISGSRSGYQVLSSPWVDGGCPGTSSAVTSNLRGMRRRQQGVPACKGRIADFVGDSSSIASAAAPANRNRPSSASSFGERGRRQGTPVARPTSAPYERSRESQNVSLGNSGSLPTLDRSDGATAPEALVL